MMFQFDLVCDHAYLSNVATTVYFLGVMMGGLVFGTLSDIHGRKPVFLACLYLQALISTSLVLAHNYLTFVILRFTLGFLLQVTVTLVCLLWGKVSVSPPSQIKTNLL